MSRGHSKNRTQKASDPARSCPSGAKERADLPKRVADSVSVVETPDTPNTAPSGQRSDVASYFFGGTWGYLSLAEVAARWSCHPNTARKLLTHCDRKLFGSMVRYAITDIEAIEQQASVVVAPSGKRAASTDRSRPRTKSSDSLAALRKRFGL